MELLSLVVVGLVAALHLYFLVLEMFLWDKPTGLRVFGHTMETARLTKTLAANQGLYNGFLSAGLVWGMMQAGDSVDVMLFFLTCIVIAGVFGAVSVSRKILFVQALPAMIGLALVLLS